MAELIELAGTLARLDPALYTGLQDEGQLETYLSAFKDSASLAESLDSSKYDFLAQVLEEDFGETWLSFHQAGILHYELLNLVKLCEPLFGEHEEDEHFLRYAVIADIDDYLKGDSDGL
jgi:hypothetical protein